MALSLNEQLNSLLSGENGVKLVTSILRLSENRVITTEDKEVQRALLERLNQEERQQLKFSHTSSESTTAVSASVPVQVPTPILFSRSSTSPAPNPNPSVSTKLGQ